MTDCARIPNCARTAAPARFANGAWLDICTLRPHASVRWISNGGGRSGRSRVPPCAGRGDRPGFPASRRVRYRARSPAPAWVCGRRPLHFSGGHRLPGCGQPRHRRTWRCLPAHGPRRTPAPPGSRWLGGLAHPMLLRRLGWLAFPDPLLPFSGLPLPGSPFSGLPVPASGTDPSPDLLRDRLLRGRLLRGRLLRGRLPGDLLPGDDQSRGAHWQCRPLRNRQFPCRLALLDGLLLGRHGRGHASPPPHPAEHHDLVGFRQRGHPAPGGRFPDVTRLGNDQLRQSLTLQYRPGRQPGDQAGWQHVQPEQIVAERHPEQRQKDDVGHSNGGKDGDLAYWQRHWKPEIVELVKPFLDPPYACIGGQLHRSLSLRPYGDQWTPSAFAMPSASVCTMLGV